MSDAPNKKQDQQNQDQQNQKATPAMQKISERMGEFYLGTTLLPQAQAEHPCLYDAADLTTHAVIIGMTGSGKTGLGISLLEEAALDNIPVIAIDPKGDLGNLALNFPEAKPEQFEPWLDAGVAAQQGLSVQALAQKTAQQWRAGVDASGQSAERQQSLKNANPVTIYTPGSGVGVSIALLSEFAPPPDEVRQDAESYAESLDATAAGLLSLLSIEVDTLAPEHVFLVHVLKTAWDSNTSLSLENMIGQIINPPFDKIGILPLNSVLDGKKRQAMAMKLNTLLASPSFASWMQGVPLDTGRLLYGSDNQPQTSVLNIAHLSDDERLFFVTLLLNNLINWMRRQQGTSTLRAILYMDEVVGYLPPTANPPTKRLLLLLLKQARAFGVGVVLSTQNPIDLDYKALSNAGTWLIGRLQTAQDRARVTEGLLSAGGAAAMTQDKLDAWFDKLGKRQFLLHNIHQPEPMIFKTRWAMSYLAGPLSKNSIERLTVQTLQRTQASQLPASPDQNAMQRSNQTTSQTLNQMTSQTTNQALNTVANSNSQPAIVPEGIVTAYLPTEPKSQGQVTHYVASILAQVQVFYDDKDSDEQIAVHYQLQYPLSAMAEEGRLLWQQATILTLPWAQLQQNPHQPASYEPVPAVVLGKDNWDDWKKSLKDYVRREQKLTLWHADELDLYSDPEESEAQFRQRLTVPLHEARDKAIKALKQKQQKAQERLYKQHESLEKKRETSAEKVSSGWVDAGLSIGTALMGVFGGRKTLSVTNARKVRTAFNRTSRVSAHKDDVAKLDEQLQDIKAQIDALQNEHQNETLKLTEQYAIDKVALKTVSISAKARDIEVMQLLLAYEDGLGYKD